MAVLFILLFFLQICTRTTLAKNMNTSDDYFDAYNPDSQRQDGDVVLALNVNWKSCNRGGSVFHSGQFYASAIAVAVEDINNNPDILPNNRLRYVWNKSETNTNCSKDISTRIMLKQINLNTIDGIIGFPQKCEAPASIASAVNLPLISLVRIYTK